MNHRCFLGDIAVMAQCWRNWGLRFGRMGELKISGAITLIGCFAIAFSGNRALAQITPDATLGAESSVVTPNVNVRGLPADRIDGGALRGINLFHSFTEFNVGEGLRVYFTNPAGIENILTRVTGANLSNVLGTLGVDGGANLFLLNPNGIIFGPNSQLDVGGSFMASTASAVTFPNGTEFSATNPQTPSLLTINVPLGLQYGGNSGSVSVQGGQLQVPDGEILALVGGEISLDGAVLAAVGGRVELGAMAGTGTVGLNGDGSNLSLSFPQGVALADISLTNGAIVFVAAGGGGSIAINAQNLTMAGESGLFAGIGSGLGSADAIAGNIEINVTGVTNLTDGSLIINPVLEGARGQGGDINITTGQLLVSNGSAVSTFTVGEGNSGNLTVNASQDIQLIGASADGSTSSLFTQAGEGSSGKAGDLTINTGTLLVRDGGFIGTGTFGTGDAGDLTVNASQDVQLIGTSADGRLGSVLSAFAGEGSSGKAGDLTINTGTLLVQDGAAVRTATSGTGDAGNLTVNASQDVQLIGTSAQGGGSGLNTQTGSGSSGKGGDLTINTGSLLVRDGAGISAFTLGTGDGGNLIVNASQDVQVIGTSADGRLGSILYVVADQDSSGKAGDLTINTGTLLVRDGAFVSAFTIGEGTGGSLMVNASQSVQLIGTSADGQISSGLTTSATPSSSGKAGDLTINTGTLLVRDGAEVDASTFGEGDGGSLTVNASEAVQVIGQSADGEVFSGLFALAAPGSSGKAGDVMINTGTLLVRDGAQVSASTFSEGDGGSLTVNASEAVQVIGTSADGQFFSGLFAQANPDSSGKGGDLTINTGTLLVRDGAQVSASTYAQGDGGSLTVNASEAVQVIGTSADGQFFSGLFAEANSDSSGKGGDLTINTGTLLVQDGAQVSASTFGQGDGGNLTVNASQDVQLLGELPDGQLGSGLVSEAFGTGAAGNVSITTGRFIATGGAYASTYTYDAGQGGELTLNASESVELIGSGRFASGIYTGTEGTGDSGDLTVNTPVLTVRDGATVFTNTSGEGDAGDVMINTDTLLARDGGFVTASTFGAGNGGNLTVNASQQVQVIGTTANGLPSAVSAGSGSIGNAGEVTINTGSLLVRDGALISARTFSSGNGGSLTVKASDSVQLSGAGSGLLVNATAGSTAGNLTVETQQMSVSDGAEVTVSSPDGQAGNLTITANSLTLNQGSITAETGTSGAESGANITLKGLDLLLMGNESLISANALGTANGGNITIDSKFIVATPPVGPEGSDIVANAVNGDGGRVNITTEGLFDIDFRPRRTPLNDITASSETGSAGVVSITQPNIDPSQGLAELPTNVVDAQGLIDRSCTPGGGSAFNSSFTVTGRGGLPSNPTEPLNSDAIVSNWVTLDSEAENQDGVASGSDRINTTTKPIVEAQGWVKTPDGQVILVAQAPSVTPQTPWLTSPSCQSAQTTTD